MLCDNKVLPASVEIDVTDEVAHGIERYERGLSIQQALPMLSDGVREQIITGTHGVCFDAAFPDEED